MKLFCAVFIVVLCAHSLAQNNAVMGLKDTLKFNHTTGGAIDSIDVAFSLQSSTYPGGGFSNKENTLPYDFFIINQGGGVLRNFEYWKKMRFSALPHLGFGYTFGGQGTQIVKANYTQAFNYNNLLNIDYNMQKGNGFIRNANFSNHDVQLQYQFTSKFYSTSIKGQYLNKTINHNGGLLEDSLIDYYGLDYAPIRKANAISNYRGTRFELEHYFDFLKNDSLNSTGLYIENKLVVFNRKYSEYSDTLSQLYTLTAINSDSTNDQYQTSEISNSAGLYFSRPSFFLKAGIQNNWWNYFNLGNHIAQSEFNLDAKLGIEIKAINIQNHTNFNFIGANREWFSKSKLNLKIKQFDINAHADVSFLLPEPFQRTYYGNSIYYDTPLDQLNKQFRMSIGGQINYAFQQHSIGIFANNATISNNYWFYNNQWTQDTLKTLNAISIGISGKTGYKFLKFSFSGSYNNSQWMPDYLLQGRLYIQGKMFKGKKLLAQIGVEGAYHNGYKTVSVLPFMDIYQLSSFSAQPMVNLHVFGAFEIQRFRFFFRVENIGYFWTEKTNRIAVDYPIPPMQIRVGITWDFLN